MRGMKENKRNRKKNKKKMNKKDKKGCKMANDVGDDKKWCTTLMV